MASHAPAPSHTARRWSASTAAPAYRPAGAVYRFRRPTETPLYPVVQHHLETFLAEAQDADPMAWGVPSWVERDAFSCKGRGVCPSCNARRMAEVAAHLTDEVIPHLPVRQWVRAQAASALPAPDARGGQCRARPLPPGDPGRTSGGESGCSGHTSRRSAGGPVPRGHRILETPTGIEGPPGEGVDTVESFDF